MVKYFIGVDVGTTSVRCGLFSADGSLLKNSDKKITIHSYDAVFYEQSSSEIWSSCCEVIKEVIKEIEPKDVSGISFDATCSLVVLDKEFQPVTVNKHNDANRNVIMWLDHRASEQADFINKTNHDVLKFVGGKISLEMEPPKLLWIKKHLPEVWKKAYYFFDLPDYLTYRATGNTTRSVCSITCKWMYTMTQGWDKSFWNQIGLSELAEDNFIRIGNNVANIGDAVGGGISFVASKETGLAAGTCVGASIIDAHCGGIGTLGSNVKGYNLPCGETINSDRIALICGTSSCHMAISKEPTFVPGVWGPYQSAMIPGYWLNEGGQSAVGNLLDHIVMSHSANNELLRICDETGKHQFTLLNEILSKLAVPSQENLDLLTRNIHVLPDFHGNRSPLADPVVKGMISGLTLDKTIDNLSLVYLATVQALAICTCHILDVMESCGHSIKVIFMTGGLTKNELFVKCHANATGRPVVLGKEQETVLLGGAVLAATASKYYSSVEEAMSNMCHIGRIVHPDPKLKKYYQAKYEVLKQMYKNEKAYRNLMNNI